MSITCPLGIKVHHFLHNPSYVFTIFTQKIKVQSYLYIINSLTDGTFLAPTKLPPRLSPKLYWLLLISLLILTGCLTVNKLGITNLAYLYGTGNNFTDVEYTVYHTSNFKSRVYYKFNTSGLKYQKDHDGTGFLATFRISYELFPSYHEKTLIDSGSVERTDTLKYNSGKRFYSSFDIKTIYPANFILSVSFTDLNSKESYTTLLEINKESSFSGQNFLLLNGENEAIFTPYVTAATDFRIKCNSEESHRLFVGYYHRDFPCALPPFLSPDNEKFSYMPDSLFTITITGGITPPVRFEKEGFYHVQLDTSRQEGITVFRFYEGFPEIVDPIRMLDPLRYLSTRREFATLESEIDTKAAVDSFWISTTGNPERATLMIRKFYMRVENANRYFTSYEEGWKTDRGLIYIIYGPPNVVYRQNNIERWIFGEEGNMMSTTFNFVKVSNPFTNNDYMLEKSTGYKESWYMAVSAWRR
jgi:GWxTD domain-containing protein